MKETWVASCLIALGYLLLVMIHGSLLGFVIYSNSATEVSQAISGIKIGTCILENWPGCLVENIKLKCVIVSFQSLIFYCAHHCINVAVRVKSDVQCGIGHLNMSCGIVPEHRMWVVLFTAALWFRETD